MRRVVVMGLLLAGLALAGCSRQSTTATSEQSSTAASTPASVLTPPPPRLPDPTTASFTPSGPSPSSGPTYSRPTYPSTPTSPMTPAPTTTSAPQTGDLSEPGKKEIAMKIVSTNENSSLDWKAQYAYIEYNVENNDEENRGYTAGIIGFCTKCGDLYSLVKYYNSIAPNNALRSYTQALSQLAQSKSSSTSGLGSGFQSAWQRSAQDPLFRQAQDHERDRVYFNPALAAAKQDGLRALGQFIYYDALVMHGPGDDQMSFGGIVQAAHDKASPPSRGGDEGQYLQAFLAARRAVMKAEQGHWDVTRIDTEQLRWVQEKNFTLSLPLSWSVYGEPYSLR